MGKRAWLERMQTNARRHPSTLAELQSLLRSGSISNSGLAAIIRKIKKAPNVLDSASIHDIERAQMASFLEVRHVHPLQLEGEATPFDWEMCDPNRLVSHLVHSCPHLADAFIRAANVHPCSASQPWRIVMAFDEYTPGMVLQPNLTRKTMNLSFSFVELGKERLWSEQFWFTPVLVRQKIIAKAAGGWSGMLRTFLQLHLTSATGISTAGLPLNLNGETFLLFAELSFLIADGDGLRQALQWKGGGGLKPCFRHWNLLDKDSGLAHRDPSFVELDCASPDLFKRARIADVHDIADTLVALQSRVAAGTVPLSKLKNVSMACGFSCTAQGLLADRSLRHIDFIAIARYDWMHSALQDGSLTTEAALLLSSAEVVGVTSSQMEAHFKRNWSYPRQRQHQGRHMWEIFESGRRLTETKIKATASDMLMLYTLLRHFFEHHVGSRDEIKEKLEAFQAACLCVDILLQAKRGRLDMKRAASLLRDAVRQHMLLHIRAHGTSYLKAKHHWMFDIADQLETDPFVLDCFLLERSHMRAKARSNLVENTRAYERSVLSAVLLCHRNNLQEESAKTFGLVGNTTPLPGRPSTLVGDRIVHAGLQISAGDIVVKNNCYTGRVSACCMEAGCFYVIVQEMRSFLVCFQVWETEGEVQVHIPSLHSKTLRNTF